MNPNYGVLLLSSIYALADLFYFSNYWSLGLSYPFYLLFFASLVLAPLLGWVWVYVVGGVLLVTGRWLEGRASYRFLRAAAAWSKIPVSINLLFWFLLFLIHPYSVFIQGAGGASTLFMNLITLILSIWSLVLLVQSVREVQGFSIGRSVINIAIAWIILSVFVFIVFTVFRLFYLNLFY